MTDAGTTNVNADDLTADHIGKIVTVRGKNAHERLRGILVNLHFDAETTDQVNGELRLGHINVLLGVLFRREILDIELGPNATVEVED